MEIVSIYRSEEDSLKNKYYISLTLGEWHNDESISGYVRTDYSSKPPKYICDHIFESSEVKFIDSDTCKKLLESAHKLSMNSSAIDNYSIKIIKNGDDYRVMIPEMQMVYYWASIYFEEPEIEEDEEAAG